MCRLVTVGRRTGRRHDIEIWFGVVDGEVCLISGGGPGSDWYQNAHAHPTVELRFDDTVVTGVARDAIGEERRRVGDVMGPKYGGWTGDPEIGLTKQAWVYDVPALLIGALALGDT